MKWQSAQRFWLAMGLIAALGAHSAGAAEKIQFSTGSKDEKKNNLAVKQAKPALQTLDFERLGGRASKAEEMAPVARPAIAQEPDEPEQTEKQKDKDWLTPEDKRDRDGKDGREGMNRDKYGQKGRDEKGRDGKNSQRDSDRSREENDPFAREKNQDPFSPLNSTGSSTNKIMFGSSNQRESQALRARQPDGSPLRNTGLPPGAGRNPLDEESRVSTLERLGLEPRSGSSAAGPGANGNVNGTSGIFGAPGVLDGTRSGNNGQVNAFGQSIGSRESGSRAMGGRDTGFKSSLMNEAGSLNPGQPGSQPRVYEPPKYERKPVVLPVPQRKF